MKKSKQNFASKLALGIVLAASIPSPPAAQELVDRSMRNFDYSYRSNGCLIDISYTASNELLADDRAEIAKSIFTIFAISNDFSRQMGNVEAHQPVAIPAAVVQQVNDAISVGGVLSPLEAEWSGLLGMSIRSATVACRGDVVAKAHDKAVARRNEIDRALTFALSEKSNLVERGLETLCQTSIEERIGLDSEKMVEINNYAFESALELANESRYVASRTRETMPKASAAMRLCILKQSGDARVIKVLIRQFPDLNNNEVMTAWVRSSLRAQGWHEQVRAEGNYAQEAIPLLMSVLNLFADQQASNNLERSIALSMTSIVVIQKERSFTLLDELLFHDNPFVSVMAEKLIIALESEGYARSQSEG